MAEVKFTRETVEAAYSRCDECGWRSNVMFYEPEHEPEQTLEEAMAAVEEQHAKDAHG